MICPSRGGSESSGYKATSETGEGYQCLGTPRPQAVSEDAEVYIKIKNWGTWVAQLVKRLTSAQVMISQLVCFGLCADSSGQLGAWSLLQILCLPLSLCPAPAHALFLSVSKINKHKKDFKSRINIPARGLTMVPNLSGLFSQATQ